MRQGPGLIKNLSMYTEIHREEMRRLARREPFSTSEWMGIIYNRVRIAEAARQIAVGETRDVERLGWLIWATHCATRAALMMALLVGRETEAARLCAFAYNICICAGEREEAWRMLAIGRRMTELSYMAHAHVFTQEEEIGR